MSNELFTIGFLIATVVTIIGEGKFNVKMYIKNSRKVQGWFKGGGHSWTTPLPPFGGHPNFIERENKRRYECVNTQRFST